MRKQKNSVEPTKISKKILKATNEAVKAALSYEDLTGRKLGITGEVGEVYACEKLNLKLVSNPLAAGYDAIDEKGNRYQIKSRKVSHKIGRIGKLSKHPFDFLVVVEFDMDYKILAIYKTTHKKVDALRKGRKSRGLPFQKTVQISEVVYP